MTRWKVVKRYGWWLAKPAVNTYFATRAFISFADAIAYADQEARAGR